MSEDVKTFNNEEELIFSAKDKGLFPIHEENLNSFVKKLTKMNNKAKKLNCSLIVFEEKDQYFLINPDNPDEVQTYHIYSVIGISPIINGYEFICTLESTDNGNILHKSPGYSGEIPEKYRDISFSVCEHCKSDRYRKELFIVLNKEKEEFKAVGSTCLKDFLGHSDPKGIAEYSSFIHSIEESLSEFSEFSGSGSYCILTHSFIAQVISLTRLKGFITSKKAYESEGNIQSTGSEAWNILTMKTYGYKDLIEYKRKYTYTEEDKNKASEIIDIMNRYYDNLSIKSDYEHNLSVILKNKVIEAKSINFLASAYLAYHKIIGEKINYYIPPEEIEKRKNEYQFSKNEYIGLIGSKVDKLNVQIKNIHSSETQYGNMFIYKFISDTGFKLCWFSSKNLERDIGDKFSISGTVKKHNEYKNERETIITRCKISEL